MDKPQIYLDKISSEDKFGFLSNVDNWSSHRPLLYLALQLTNESKLPVLEMGCGEGSSHYLQNYCNETDRKLVSYDSNKEWAEKYNSVFVDDWWNRPDIFETNYSVAFIDHAPGEHRWIAIKKLVDKCDIIVFHDAELFGAGDYKYENIRHLFKYELDYNLIGGGAGCSAVSNKINLDVFKVCSLTNFKFDA